MHIETIIINDCWNLSLSICSRGDIVAIVEQRFMSCPIHGMAALLHPFYKKPELFSERTLLTLKDQYINIMYDEDEQLEVDAKMVSFTNNLGPSFAKAVVLREEATKFPLTWWQSYGRQGFPNLTHLAFQILSRVLLSL